MAMHYVIEERQVAPPQLLEIAFRGIRFGHVHQIILRKENDDPWSRASGKILHIRSKRIRYSNACRAHGIG